MERNDLLRMGFYMAIGTAVGQPIGRMVEAFIEMLLLSAL